MRTISHLYLVFAVILGALPSGAIAQWVNVSGPFNEPVNCFATGGNRIYAGTDGDGILISSDNGMNWTRADTGLTDPYIWSLAVNGTDIFAGTGVGIFVSTNNGLTWSKTDSSGPNDLVSTLAVTPGYLIAGTVSGVYVSTDNGSTWTQRNNGLVGPDVTRLLFNGPELVAGILSYDDAYTGVFISTDHGMTWSRRDSGLAGRQIGPLAVLGDRLVAAAGNGVFSSTNDGMTWTETDSGLDDRGITALATSGANLLAGTQFGVFVSSDSARSWSRVDSSLIGDVDAFAVDGMNTILAADNPFRICLSTDFGTSWVEENSALRGNITSAVAIRADIFVGSNGGIYHSKDNGKIWLSSDVGLTNLYVTGLVTYRGDLFAGTQGSGVYVSTNSGSSWNRRDSGMGNTFIDAMVLKDTTLIVSASHGVFYSSTDGALNWKKLDSIGANVSSLAVSGANLFAATNLGVYISTNSGSTWTPENNGLADTYVSFLAVAGSYLAAGTNIGSTPVVGVYVSSDNGTSWTQENTGLPQTLISGLGAYHTDLFVGTSYYGSIFISTNEGADWVPFDAGLQYRWGISGFTFNDSNLYAWGGNTLWCRPLSDIITGTNRPGNTIPTRFQLLQNYPNPFNPSTVISYLLPARTRVVLEVFNLLGQKVGTLVDKQQSAGEHIVTFSAGKLASGVYFYRLQAGTLVATKKLMVLK